MNKDPYYLTARLAPAALTAAPLLILLINTVSLLSTNFLAEINIILPVLVYLGIYAALTFLLVQLNRLVAKEVFQKIYFKDEINMPSTNHLLWQDDYIDRSIKKQIREKISRMYGIKLLSINNESVNESRARKLIVSAVSQIKNSLRGNKLLFQHNIEYGFFRNFVGGSFIAVLASFALTIFGQYQHDSATVQTGLVMLSVYILPIIFSQFLINRFGNYYSKILYEQFLSIPEFVAQTA